MSSITRALLAFVLLVSLLSQSRAQTKTPILERKVTLEWKNEKLASALQQLEREGGFSFSYNASLIPEDKQITLSVRNRSVRDVLYDIFGNTMQFREKGSHLIITKAPPSNAAPSVFLVSGYVEDAATGQRISNASVYEKESVTSVVTDRYGHFKLKLDAKSSGANIAVSKKNYLDTMVSIATPTNQHISIKLSPKLTPPAATSSEAVDSVLQNPEDAMPLPFENEPNIQNITDTLYRQVQISFLPFLGSNGLLSGNVINDYSINMLGGYSLGTRQIELGFFFNMDRGDVRWLQVAGFGNLVGGDVNGIQGSGFFNVNGGRVTAVQGTGFGNVNLGDVAGVQMAGFANVNVKSINGVSVAGFANYTRNTSKGVQVAGFANIMQGNFGGTQVAGFANVATAEIEGPQIASFFNYGKTVKGTQIAIFNYADSLEGVPVGIFSYVKSGYHKIELSADEVFYANVAFRSGVRQFYNMVFAGMKTEHTTDGEYVWTFGYGIGTAPRLARWLDLNIDLSSQHVNKGDFTNELSLLNKFYVGLDFKLARKFSIATGVTLNGYLTKANFTDYAPLFSDFTPNVFVDNTYSNDTNLRMWVGGKIGLRFL